MLEQLGYGVHTVSDADAALEILERLSFDLVISDIVMPGGIDGLALARMVRKRKPEVPVLLVTGYSRTAAEASREFVVLRKPFELSDLSRAAARLIAEAKQPPTSNVVRLRAARDEQRFNPGKT
jgi:DNA-binding NtrC family response regulator